MKDKQTAAAERVFRDADKRAATTEAADRRAAVVQKTADLRALRLEKEAAERLEQGNAPRKATRKKPAARKRS